MVAVANTISKIFSIVFQRIFRATLYLRFIVLGKAVNVIALFQTEYPRKPWLDAHISISLFLQNGEVLDEVNVVHEKFWD